VTLLGLFGAPAVIRHSRNCVPLLSPSYAPGWEYLVSHSRGSNKNVKSSDGSIPTSHM